VGNQRRRQRVLRARTEAADEERNDQSHDATAQSSEDIAQPGQRGAKRKNRGGTETLGQEPRRNLKAGKRS